MNLDLFRYQPRIDHATSVTYQSAGYSQVWDVCLACAPMAQGLGFYTEDFGYFFFIYQVSLFSNIVLEIGY